MRRPIHVSIGSPSRDGKPVLKDWLSIYLHFLLSRYRQSISHLQILQLSTLQLHNHNSIFINPNAQPNTISTARPLTKSIFQQASPTMNHEQQNRERAQSLAQHRRGSHPAEQLPSYSAAGRAPAYTLSATQSVISGRSHAQSEDRRSSKMSSLKFFAKGMTVGPIHVLTRDHS